MELDDSWTQGSSYFPLYPFPPTPHTPKPPVSFFSASVSLASYSPSVHLQNMRTFSREQMIWWKSMPECLWLFGNNGWRRVESIKVNLTKSVNLRIIFSIILSALNAIPLTKKKKKIHIFWFKVLCLCIFRKYICNILKCNIERNRTSTKRWRIEVTF